MSTSQHLEDVRGGGSGRSRAAVLAVVASTLGFALSRAYPWALASWDFITLDYFLAVAMAASHLGFLVAVGVLAHRLLGRDVARGAGGVARWTLPLVAAGLSVLTYLWVP